MSENEYSRRDLIRNAAFAAALGGVSEEAMADVHLLAQADKASGGGTYKPKVFAAGEWATLRRLCHLIIPPDNVSAGAVEAGAPEYIDLLSTGSDELTTKLLGGIHWLDNQMQAKVGKTFVEATEAEQTALLDQIAFRKNDSPALATGIRFFELIRRMTVDAFYTSKIGIADVGYKGNKGMTEFQVPKEALEYALKRSPV